MLFIILILLGDLVLIIKLVSKKNRSKFIPNNCAPSGA